MRKKMLKKIKNWFNSLFCNEKDLRVQLKNEKVRAERYKASYFTLKNQMRAVLREATNAEKKINLGELKL